MKLLLPISLVFALSICLSGCGSESGFSADKQISPILLSSRHEEACRVLSDYANKIERIYLQYEWTEMGKKLSQEETDYRSRMSKLDEEGKWTPRQNFGKSLELPFLLGRFHGALESCKIERMRKDASAVGCDQAKNLKDAIEKLCSE